jgi:hypothetical protein
MLAALVRFLFLFLLLGALVRSIFSWLHSLAPAPEQREPPRAAGTLVRDRICNTFVPRERALSATIAGHEEFFCSEGCRAKALRPAQPDLPRSAA